MLKWLAKFIFFVVEVNRPIQYSSKASDWLSFFFILTLTCTLYAMSYERLAHWTQFRRYQPLSVWSLLPGLQKVGLCVGRVK